MSAAPDMTSRRVTRDGRACCQGLARILDEAAWDGQSYNPRPSAARPTAPGQLQDLRRLHHLQRAEEEADQALRAGPHPVPHRRRAPRPDLRIHPQHQHSETVGRRRPGRPGATVAAAAATAGVGAAAGAETHAGLDDYVSQDKSPGGARHPASHGGRKRLRTRERKKRPHLGRTPAAASRAPMRISADSAPSVPYKTGSLPASARQRGRDRAESTTHLARKRSLPLPDTRSTGSACVI